MADLIGTEKDAKDISGANVVIEDKKCVTKARALEIGAAVKNESNYENNLLVKVDDLEASLKLGFAIQNPYHSASVNSAKYKVSGVTENCYLNLNKLWDNDDSRYPDVVSAKAGSKTVAVYRAMNPTVPNDPETRTTSSCCWAVVLYSGNSTQLAVYVNQGAGGTLWGNMYKRYTITSPNTSYPYISSAPISLYTLGATLTLYFECRNSSGITGALYFVRMDREKANTVALTYVNVTGNAYVYSDSSGTNSNQVVPATNRSNPNKYGIMVARSNATYGINSSNGADSLLYVRMYDFNKMIASAWVRTILPYLGIGLPYTEYSIPDWVEDGTLYGSWYVTAHGYYWGSEITLVPRTIKIANLTFTNGGTFTCTNVTSTFNSNQMLAHISHDIAYDKYNNWYFIAAKSCWPVPTKDYVYVASGNLGTFTNIFGTKSLDDVLTENNITPAGNWNLYSILVASGGIVVIKGYLWVLVLLQVSSNSTEYKVIGAKSYTENDLGYWDAFDFTPHFLFENQFGPAISSGGRDFVDLGLPSGTLWASMNVGATYEYQTGSTYSFSVIGSPSSANVYNGLHNNWGGNWVIPSIAQWAELSANTNASKVTLGGYTCLKCTSKTNSNYILLPLNLSSSGTYYAYYPAQDMSNGGWYVQVWDTYIYANPQNAFGGSVTSPVRGVLTPSLLTFTY